MEALDVRQMTSVEGRVLVHGEDEQSGRHYLMLEGVDARVHFIEYTPKMGEARARGDLRANSFVRFRRISTEDESQLQIDNLGDADGFLKNRSYFRSLARELLKRGILPAEDGWGGWLGHYQAALKEAATRLEYPEQPRDHDRKRDRPRDR